MRTVFCRVLKAPFPGDELRLCYTTAHGGMTEAAYLVKKSDFYRVVSDAEASTAEVDGRKVDRYVPGPDDEDRTPVNYLLLSEPEMREAIASKLSEAIGRQWTGELFACKVRRDEIVITCSQDDIKFFPMRNGAEAAGREYLEVEH